MDELSLLLPQRVVLVVTCHVRGRQLPGRRARTVVFAVDRFGAEACHVGCLLAEHFVVLEVTQHVRARQMPRIVL